MPLSDAYVNAVLDAVGAALPSSGHWRLYASDPTLAALPSDVELDTATGGYTPPTFAPSQWASAADNSLTTTTAPSFGTSTAAYSDVAAYWGITGTDADDLAYSDFLDDPIEVDDTGTSVSFSPTLLFGDGD